MQTRLFSGTEMAASILDGLAPRSGDGLHVLADPGAAGAAAYARRISEQAARIGLPLVLTGYPQTDAERATLLSSRTLPVLALSPAPAGFDRQGFLDQLGPDRDVEGLHPGNAGLLATGRAGIMPPTAEAATLIAEHLAGSLSRAVVAIVGASASVGRPLAMAMLARGATVRVAQDTTKDLAGETRDADIVCAAAGVPGLIGRAHLRKGTIAIDIGVTRVGDRLVGDIDAEGVIGHVAWLTEVPDGVGPVTTACLMRNALRACRSCDPAET